jgi:hypothetical protein
MTINPDKCKAASFAEARVKERKKVLFWGSINPGSK